MFWPYRPILALAGDQLTCGEENLCMETPHWSLISYTYGLYALVTSALFQWASLFFFFPRP